MVRFWVREIIRPQKDPFLVRYGWKGTRNWSLSLSRRGHVKEGHGENVGDHDDVANCRVGNCVVVRYFIVMASQVTLRCQFAAMVTQMANIGLVGGSGQAFCGEAQNRLQGCAEKIRPLFVHNIRSNSCVVQVRIQTSKTDVSPRIPLILKT